MNRREFTASLAALVTAPALPIPLAAQAVPPSLPPATYLWADLIARARGSVDAGFLARRLGLTPAMAASVMDQLVTDGVLKAPGLSGLAKASNPIRFDAPAPSKLSRVLDDAQRHVRDALAEPTEIENIQQVAPEAPDDSASGVPQDDTA